MIDLPQSLKDHIAGTITTLAFCWTITRKDGATFGFTDHDMPLTVNAVVHDPQTGLTFQLARYGQYMQSSFELRVLYGVKAVKTDFEDRLVLFHEYQFRFSHVFLLLSAWLGRALTQLSIRENPYFNGLFHRHLRKTLEIPH